MNTSSKQESLNKLKQKIIRELDCELKDSSSNLVFGKGNPDAQIFIIGEAPGKEEDLKGIPFVGRSGKIIDDLLVENNLSLDDVYVANILKYRPPKNRNPHMNEIKLHTPYLIEQIKIIHPKIICTLGNFSTRFVLSKFDTKKMNTIDGISKLHGKVLNLNIDGENYKVVPLYHPAATLYRPKLKGVLSADFQNINILVNK